MISQLVGAFVFGVAGMAFHPLPGYLVAGDLLVELLPEFGVFHGLFGGSFPAVFLPAVNPAFHAVFHVLGVGVDGYLAGAVEGFEAADNGGKLHAVVGGVGFAAAEFFFMAAVAQQHAPAAGAGITFAGAVGVEVDGCGIGHGVWVGAT